MDQSSQHEKAGTGDSRLLDNIAGAHVGRWRIELYETIESPAHLDATVDTPGGQLAIRLPGKNTINEAVAFFDETLNNPKYRDEETAPGRFIYNTNLDPLCVGYFDDIPVKLIKIGKHDDMYNIVIRVDTEDVGCGQFMFRIGGQDLLDLIATLRKVAEQLTE